MRMLRWVASLLVVGPVVGLIFTAYGMVSSFLHVSQGGAKPNPEFLSRCIQIALFATFLGILAFPLGVILHALVARKTGTYSRRVWILILEMSILLCLVAFPGGTVLGGVTIALLFILKTFRRMLRDEHPVRGDFAPPADGGPSGTPEQ